jgi:hypothetical protein
LLQVILGSGGRDRDLARVPAPRNGSPIFSQQFPKFSSRQLGNLADSMTKSSEVAKQTEALDVSIGVKPAIGTGALRLHRSIPLLPNPDHMWCQSGPVSGDANRMSKVLHHQKLEYSLLCSICQYFVHFNRVPAAALFH